MSDNLQNYQGSSLTPICNVSKPFLSRVDGYSSPVINCLTMKLKLVISMNKVHFLLSSLAGGVSLPPRSAPVSR